MKHLLSFLAIFAVILCGCTRTIYQREFGIRNAMKQKNRQLEKVADSFGSIIDI